MLVEWSPLTSNGIFSYQVYLKWSDENSTHVKLVCENINTKCNFRLDKLKVPHSIFVKAKKINKNPGSIKNGIQRILYMYNEIINWHKQQLFLCQISALLKILHDLNVKPYRVEKLSLVNPKSKLSYCTLVNGSRRFIYRKSGGWHPVSTTATWVTLSESVKWSYDKFLSMSGGFECDLSLHDFLKSHQKL